MPKKANMPIAAPVVAAGLQLFGTAANALSQGSANRAAREFAWNMYSRQRQDALADWERQNQYDSPAQQMARLKAAGLNPNLVYGKGADNTSSPVRSSPAPSYNPTPPRFDVGSISERYFSTQMQQAQIDNVKTQNDVLKQDILLKAAQTTGIAANTASTQFKLDLDKQLREISAEAAKLGVEQQRANIDYTLDKNDREAASNAKSIEEATERILNLRSTRETNIKERKKIDQEINNLKADETIKKLDAKLREMGVYPGDPTWWRALGRVVNNIPSTEALREADRKGVKSAATPFSQMGLDWMNLFR